MIEIVPGPIVGRDQVINDDLRVVLLHEVYKIEIPSAHVVDMSAYRHESRLLQQAAYELDEIVVAVEDGDNGRLVCHARHPCKEGSYSVIAASALAVLMYSS